MMVPLQIIANINVRGPNNVGRAVPLLYARVGSKVWLVSNFVQQLPAKLQCSNMLQGVQTDATCNIQQRWDSVCTGPILY